MSYATPIISFTVSIGNGNVSRAVLRSLIKVHQRHLLPPIRRILAVTTILLLIRLGLMSSPRFALTSSATLWGRGGGVRVISSSFGFRFEEQPHAVIALIEGEIDLSNAAMVLARLNSAVDRGRDVVVDITDVTFLDLRGVEALEAAHRRAAEQGRRMALVASQPVVHRILEITQVLKLISTADSVADALRMLGAS